ncbi:3',5'-cyclic-nucleotide phosphodiesterase [Blastocladiella emersonii ATCC 22665]|nr:3',5'-cyclic-nucleotide phosphodiesterase [Blastocladiella emersonii ATCC 22665]
MAATDGVGGVPRLKTVLSQYPSALRINTHGFIGSGAMFAKSAGTVETDVLSTIFHATGFGTRELGLGVSRLASNVVARAGTTAVLASTWSFASRSSLFTGVKPYTVLSAVDSVTNAAVRIGVVTLGNPAICTVANCNDLTGPVLRPSLNATTRLRELVAQLTAMESVQLVVAIGTSASPSAAAAELALAHTVPGIDVVLLGATAAALPGVASPANFPWITTNAAGGHPLHVALLPGDSGAAVGIVHLDGITSATSPLTSIVTVSGARVALSCPDPAATTCVQPDSATQTDITNRLAALVSASSSFSLSLGSALRASACASNTECALGALVARAVRSTGSCSASLVTVAPLVNVTTRDAGTSLSWDDLRAVYPANDAVGVAMVSTLDLVDWVTWARASDGFAQASGLAVTLNAAGAIIDVAVGGTSVVTGDQARTITVCTTGSMLARMPDALRARLAADAWNINVIDAMYLAYVGSPSAFTFAPEGTWTVSSASQATAVVTGTCTYNASATLAGSPKPAASQQEQCTGIRLGADFTHELFAPGGGAQQLVAMALNLTLPDFTGGDAAYIASSPSAPPAVTLTSSGIATAPFAPAYVRIVYTGRRISSAPVTIAATGLTACPDGYIPLGSNACEACPAGSYRNGTLSWCAPCPAGTVASATGSTSCTPCSAGSVAASAGQSTCSACPAAMYAPAMGLSACLACTAPRIRASNALCVCPIDGHVFDPSTGACTAPGVMSSIAITSSFLAGAAGLLIFATVVSVYMWSKKRPRSSSGGSGSKGSGRTPRSVIQSQQQAQLSSQIQNQLSSSAAASQLSGGGVDAQLDAPIKRAIDILQMLKASTVSARLKKQIDHVVAILVAGDMFSPQLDQLEGEDMDDEVKEWLATTIVGKRTSTTSDTRAVVGTATRMHATVGRVANAGSIPFEQPASLVADAIPAIEYLANDVFRLGTLHTTRVREMLEASHQWDFDIFAFTEATNGHPLLFLSYYMIKKLKLLEEIKGVEEIILLQYLDEIELTYQDNPYHNAIHAADMTQAMWVFLHDERLAGACSPLELFAVILACAMHDVDHPGVTNAFIVKSRHPLALLYSDTSVLEFHHAATGISVAERRGLFKKMGPSYEDLRKMIIELVMATDMAKHFEFLNKFKSQLAAATAESQSNATGASAGSGAPASPSSANTAVNSPTGGGGGSPATPTGSSAAGSPPSEGVMLKLDKPEIKVLVLIIAMKCSDLNNPTRPRPTSLEWTGRIMEEFYVQGDQERALNLPISKFMDRMSQADENVAKCQTSFIDVIVSPLYQVWTSYLRSSVTNSIMANVHANRHYWSQGARSRDNLTNSPSMAAGGGGSKFTVNGSTNIVASGLVSGAFPASAAGSRSNFHFRKERSASFTGSTGTTGAAVRGVRPIPLPASSAPGSGAVGGSRSDSHGSTASSLGSTGTSIASIRTNNTGHASLRFRSTSEYTHGAINYNAFHYGFTAADAAGGGGGSGQGADGQTAGDEPGVPLGAGNGPTVSSILANITEDSNSSLAKTQGSSALDSTATALDVVSMEGGVGSVSSSHAGIPTSMPALETAGGGGGGGLRIAAPSNRRSSFSSTASAEYATSRRGSIGGAPPPMTLPGATAAVPSPAAPVPVRRGSASLQGLRALPRAISSQGAIGMPNVILEEEDGVHEDPSRPAAQGKEAVQPSAAAEAPVPILVDEPPRITPSLQP